MIDGFSNMVNEKRDNVLIKLLQEVDEDGNTPLMCAAIHEESQSLSRLLLVYYGNMKHNRLNHMLHHRNKKDASILSLVHSSNETMFGPYGLLLELEMHAHMRSKEDNYGFLELQACLRNHCGSSNETIRTLGMIKSTTSKSNQEVAMIYFRMMIGLLIIPLGFYISDVTTDSLMTEQYYQNWRKTQNITLGVINTEMNSCNSSISTLQEYPECLSDIATFFYSLVFIGGPYIFYANEFRKNDFYENMKQGIKDAVARCIKCDIGSNIVSVTIFYMISPFCIALWPIITIFLNFYYGARYETSRGVMRNELENTLRVTAQACGRAKLLEASIEATFQPVLQWYLLYPKVMRQIIMGNIFSVEMITHSEDIIAYLSIITSVLSLAWSFTAHKATYKHGALDLTVSPLSRAVLFLSDLLFIISRMNCLIIYMYWFGPGQFYPGIVFLMIHLIIMIVLHIIFMEEFNWSWNYFKGAQSLTFAHACFLNGLANMFSNNGAVIMADSITKQDKGKTFIRHLVYDSIFVCEIIVLAVFGFHLHIEPAQQLDAKNTTLIVSLCCHFVALVLKTFYYTKLHVWSALIKVVKKDENENWVFETDYSFLGSKKMLCKKIPLINKSNEANTDDFNDDRTLKFEL